MISENYCDGIITKGIGGFYYVKSGEKLIECRGAGRLRKNELSPIVGDYVTVKLLDDKTGSVVEIKPRKNYLTRPGVSNVDAVMLVSAARSPLPDMLLTDKLLVIAESKNIHGFICLNKTDLAESGEVRDFISVYEPYGSILMSLTWLMNLGTMSSLV